MPFQLEWKSSEAQRYDTPMMDEVQALLSREGVKVLDIYGGTALGETIVELASDNGVVVDTDEATATRLAGLLQEQHGHPVSVDNLES